MEKRKQRAYKELNRLSLNLKGEVQQENDTNILKLADGIGRGEVKCINFDDGLFMMEFNVHLKEDTYLGLVSENDQSIYFLYCFEGDCFYTAHHNNHLVKLNELQTAIIKTTNGFTGGLILKPNSDITLNLLRVDVKTYFEKHNNNPTFIAQKFKSFLSELNSKHHMVHLGKMNLDIADYIKKLGKAKYADSLSELLYFEGICVLILASHIEQYKREISGVVNPTKLIKRELVKIMDVAKHIQENPEMCFTIDKLCLRSSLSAAKLQEGFKFLYNRTVSDFIRNTRLEKAEALIKNTDMNISEVVYSVGLTSRSYFCKIFKAKYKCNPKEYKSKLNIRMSSEVSEQHD
ncbi:HTH-type transcriptional regulator AlkR [Flagellimonas maritima]|uniref:HTH-type transcriptional regulator AlkR n=1 Tax=Flagellimonas maritima TaxID=1383885 RepID=A0A2Z4LN26_9FLAO|nr:AraC family transcriptional regulator [Allomuricauda aurantiaca]AWX43203.1 HTH-type transcriptional regulator AlkR [Allomuricauda aurantiaca]